MPLLLNHLLKINLNMTESPSYHPAQKMELKERAKDADEISLSRFIIKILKKHGYLTS